MSFLASLEACPRCYDRPCTCSPIDPVCLSHGVPWSQNPPHWAGKCLICQLCFRVLGGTDECNSLGDGSYEDVCIGCAAAEAFEEAERQAKRDAPTFSVHDEEER